MTRLAGADDWFHTEYTSGRWEPDTHDILRQHLSPDDLFVDVGAWIGPVTRWALDLGAHARAFEPDPVAYPHLVANCPLATCYEFAVSREHIRLENRENMGDSNTRSIIDPTNRDVLIMSPLGACVGGPALIKIDVEGYETEILQEFLSVAHCPIWVAWHEELWPDTFIDGWDFTGWDVDGPVGGWSHSLLTPQEPADV